MTPAAPDSDPPPDPPPELTGSPVPAMPPLDDDAPTWELLPIPNQGEEIDRYRPPAKDRLDPITLVGKPDKPLRRFHGVAGGVMVRDTGGKPDGDAGALKRVVVHGDRGRHGTPHSRAAHSRDPSPCMGSAAGHGGRRRPGCDRCRRRHPHRCVVGGRQVVTPVARGPRR